MHHDAPVEQNDPDELLEVFDSAGRATGQAKSRGAVHLEGDWHRAFHCWILRRGGSEVVLQRRSTFKDTYPGCWDAAAAGHWRFGESAAEAAREIAEELGIEVQFDLLRYVGRERTQRKFANGLIDRELHEVYVLDDDRPLTAYRPAPSEVSALGAFQLEELLELIDRGRDRLQAVDAVTVGADGRVEHAALAVTPAELVPYTTARLRRNLGRPDRVDTI